ncbi:16S rRNA (cytosine(1402)-N(4))-methyltransferase RsmH [Candidatus Saccharibacteria bacterium]|nr:16S rRNA (cytosine(1402)-N(4))-methyltransferase RsmH [Candidatus Saccharibacteria bacterium]MBR3323296.1 16S rRNA (cytosine(1402)-N(4))-methyltransferase RsmH [Candidatus Saccharibacteria bacterium]
MNKLHIPVLLSEVLDVTQPQPGENYLDLTAGYAGHASKILDVTQQYKTSVLCDRDDFAIDYLRKKFASTDITIMKSDFCNAVWQLLESGATFDIILADFGVSSPQLDNPDRGFSLMQDGPLDMRMDQTQALTADVVVNKWRARELEEIFMKYGELSPGLSKRYAREICIGRPWKSTLQLANAPFWGKRGRIHPATRVFQAIRIAVNDELGEIERTLPALPKLLKPGGRLAIISFHSLEDRLVKQFFKEQSSMGEESSLEILTKKPMTAGDVELGINPRARSAKLRAARKRM